MKTMTAVPLALALSLLVAATACDDDGYYYYEDAYASYYDTAYWLEYEEAYYWYGYDPFYGYYWLGPESEEQDPASEIARLAPEYFEPEGCVDATAVEDTATLIFDACQGPGVLAEVTGELSLTYSQVEAGFALEIVSPGLQIGDAELEIMSSAVATADGDLLTVEANTSIRGVAATGNIVDRDGDYTMQWRHGEECFELEGQVVDGEATTHIADYRRCQRLCPERGMITRERGARSVTLTFDGSEQATWRGDDGQTGTLDLGCQREGE